MMQYKTSLLLVLMIGASSLSMADVRTRYGGVVKSDVSVEGALIATYQNSSDSRLDDELLMSLDLVAHRNLGDGQLTIYAEANTTPQANGIAALIGQANGDAGSALDGEGRGRFQISELHYTCTNNQSCVSFGLLDLSAFADLSQIANDETTQFLNTSLVNNPTIAFPDYTLGFVIHKDFSAKAPGYTWLLSSSHGLADNPDRSYSELLDVSAEGKGVFSLLEFYAGIESGTVRAGAWYSSADRTSLNGNADDRHNYGVYLTLDRYTSTINWMLRLGAANPEVSEAAYFAGLAMEHQSGDNRFGFGLTRTWLSDEIIASQRQDRNAAELYARMTLAERLAISPSVQWIDNPGFDSSESRFDSPIAVYSLRANYHF